MAVCIFFAKLLADRTRPHSVRSRLSHSVASVCRRLSSSSSSVVCLYRMYCG